LTGHDGVAINLRRRQNAALSAPLHGSATALCHDRRMMGVFDPEAHFALICSLVEQRADGAYQARLGETVLRSAFQPIVEVTGGDLKVCGYEALIRPYRNGCGIPAGTFFADATPEETMHIDRLCLALHFRNFAAFGPKDATILVNVDPAGYGDDDLTGMAADYSLKRLEECGLKPQQVIFEIVERPSTDERAIFAVAERHRAAGARIAVDDFGGQALDFARLAMLRPDIVKMDGGVLQKARSGGPQLKLLSRLCQVVDRFGLDLLIEGVETADDLQTCLQFNPRYLQGYNFGRPVKRPLAGERYARRLARARMPPAGGLDEKTATA
jgi:EAL domain-containing protein (putative c-di-GMP-specific phosphodiesterase class I)